jgi:predicted RNA binding protein YcfA (HicA-like mRNA interferase family)
MNMAYDLDKDELPDSYERIFIVIDPIVGSDSEDLLKENYCSPEEVEQKRFVSQLLNNGLQVVKMITSHSQYKDWQKAYKINNHLVFSNIINNYLSDIIQQINEEDLPDKKLLREHLIQIIETKYKATAHKNNSDNIPAENLLRSELEKLGKEYITPHLSSSQKEFFLLLVSLLDNTSGLRRKQKVKLIGIAPKSIQHTKGEFLSAFGGFFNSKWRQYDYNVGQYDAFEKLSIFDNILVNANNIKTIKDPSLSESNIRKNITFSDIPEHERKLFKSYLSLLLNNKIIPHLTKTDKWFKRLFISAIPFGILKIIIVNKIIKKLSSDHEIDSQKECLHDNHLV